MTLFSCESGLYYFSHIPKSGGSTVEFALRKAGAKRALHYHKKLDYLQCNLQHMHAELFDTFVPPQFYRKGFCVVRHPMSRLVSEYFWRDSLGHVHAKFDTWVNKRLREYQKNNYILDNHFRPQHEFVGKKIDVLRFENGMENILKDISEMTGLKLALDTHRRKNAEKSDLIWTEQTRAKVTNFYRKDFDRFGYAPDAEIKYLQTK